MFLGFESNLSGHREGVIGAIDFYMEWKSVYVDYSDKLQKAQIDSVLPEMGRAAAPLRISASACVWRAYTFVR